jgi:hypothetical protein
LLSDSRGDKRKFERDLHKFHYQEWSFFQWWGRRFCVLLQFVPFLLNSA